MSNCLFCNRKIPKSRYDLWHHKIKYCSYKCGKRYIYLKYTKNKSSFFKNDPEWFETATGSGYIWEQFVVNLLNGQWQGFGSPYDILWNGKKIDVKTSNLYKRKYKRGKPVIKEPTGWFSFHKYHTKKEKKGVDYLFCIGLIKNIPYKMWVIPYDDVSKTFVITPNPSKKYDKYLFKI